MPKITFIDPDGARHEVDAAVGQSVLAAALRHGVGMEGACEGSLSCSTCHVIVEPEGYHRLPGMAADEREMLDLAFGHTRTSRLGCQILVTEALDGLVVRISPRFG